MVKQLPGFKYRKRWFKISRIIVFFTRNSTLIHLSWENNITCKKVWLSRKWAFDAEKGDLNFYKFLNILYDEVKKYIFLWENNNCLLEMFIFVVYRKKIQYSKVHLMVPSFFIFIFKLN